MLQEDVDGVRADHSSLEIVGCEFQGRGSADDDVEELVAEDAVVGKDPHEMLCSGLQPERLLAAAAVLSGAGSKSKNR